MNIIKSPIAEKLDSMSQDLKMYLNSLDTFDQSNILKPEEVQILLDIRTVLKEVSHQLKTGTVEKYKFKIVCEIDEYGMNPLWDKNQLFYSDTDLDTFISKNYDEDDDYQVWGFTGCGFELIKEQVNF
jgi:hypothetical protein